MAERSLYEILGVSRDTPRDEIRKAYRKLARKYHPDVNPDDPEAEAKFKEVSAAWDVVGDEEKRARYDEFGDESLASGFDPEKARAWKQWQGQPRGSGAGFPGGGFPQGGFGPGGIDLEEMFGDLLGRRGRRGPARGRDVAASLALDFGTAARGGEVQLRIDDRSVTVRIPPGIVDGETIRLRGQGPPGDAGQPAGDLLITVGIGPHEVWRREGLDLYLDLPITVGEAVRGGKVRVPTLDGEVTMTLKPGSQSGLRVRLRGKGITRREKIGDLYATLQVRVPPEADGEVLDQLEASYPNDVRAELFGAVAGGR